MGVLLTSVSLALLIDIAHSASLGVEKGAAIEGAAADRVRSEQLFSCGDEVH